MTERTISRLSSSRPTTAPIARKVKTGCGTCKIRKVKCDETYPACRRCLQTGRVCDGYGIWGGGNRPAVPARATEQLDSGGTLWRSEQYVQGLRKLQPGLRGNDPRVTGEHTEVDDHVSLVSIKGTSVNSPANLRLVPIHVVPTDQHGYMEWYICRTAPKLPGAFRESFWDRLLPQASQSEPAILHAILSLASIHKRALLDLVPCSVRNAKEIGSLFTLQQLTLATGTLRDRIANRSQASLRVALIACAVFIVLEYMQDNYQTGLTHLRHGLILLEEFMLHDGQSNGDANDDSIINTFVTLLIQARLLGQDIYHPSLLPLLIDKLDVRCWEFQSAADARRCLEWIFLQTFSIADQTGCNLFCDRLSSSITVQPNQMMDIHQYLRLWQGAYETSMMRFRSMLSLMDFYSWKLLLLLHTLACVLVQDFAPTVYEQVVDSSATESSTRPPDTSSRDASSAAFSTVPTLLASHVPSSHSGSRTEYSSGIGLPRDPCLSIISQCSWIYREVRDPVPVLYDTNSLGINETAASSIADIGWMPALFYTAILARDSTTRREAANLLYLRPHREGIWESYLSGILAEKIIHTKEEKRNTQPPSNSSMNLEGDLGHALETSTLRDIRIQLPSSSDAKLVLTYARLLGDVAGAESWNNERCIYDMRAGCWIS
ncbi:hypothetical protein PV08_07701 [Exophiala spinifera]|uniref:Zn(2)-C6 fungal-type domain-containing protein n=1 Tax=Exophiala spinifera TaxID=91928 RepID=A0A0D1YJ03_9EURO|nr:uncharacterized protein PV08_07701 [Exophiala spinifera]KIW14916.1 hypothetical protein PV08_07701 [Exophiala spinifera]